MPKNKTQVIYFQKDMPFQPKFKVGDRVRTPKDLYNETTGQIYEVHRNFQELDHNGNFDWDGLCTCTPHIGGCLPYSFDGMTIKTWYPREDFGGWIRKAYVLTQKFSGYSYSVKSKKLNTLWDESSLKKLK